MKRVITALILLFAVAVMCVYSNNKLIKDFNEVKSILKEARSSAESGDYKRAAELTEKADNAVRAGETFYHMIAAHTELSDISTQLSRLEIIARTDAKDIYISECEYLIVKIEDFISSQTSIIRHLI